jgi:hypothetical protein
MTVAVQNTAWLPKIPNFPAFSLSPMWGKGIERSSIQGDGVSALEPQRVGGRSVAAFKGMGDGCSMNFFTVTISQYNCDDGLLKRR